jgi:hypothetical protein
MSRKSCGRGTSDWRVIPAGCELLRKEISSERIIVSEELQARLIVWEEFWAWHRLGGASGKALSSISLEFSTYTRDTALEECGDGFECGYHVGWFRVESGGGVCTLVLVYVSIRLRETVSEFRSIERFSTADKVQ